ncbi:MAG TPA: glycosyltransferase [Candidatus Acidoferrales bacterium]|nr:glycosyltransferase [Candidatus Acidoferrales bacterium]
MSVLEDYEPFVGRGAIEELRLIGDQLSRKRIVTVNSTAIGGGVAEILNRMVPLSREVGVDIRWDVIKGGEDFFALTKRMHNALHGKPEVFSSRDAEVFRETTKQNLAEMDLDADVLLIHDPQPVGLIDARRTGRGRWVWRCHIDLSTPVADFWNFLSGYVQQYDATVFSAPQFSRDLEGPQVMIAPSIDPLSDKNRELTDAEIDQVLYRLHVPRDKPIVTQVSRFDRLKDPLGVVNAFRSARRYNDCRLVLAGGGAADDPEGAEVLRSVHEAAADDPDIHVLDLPPTANVEINALQRASAVVLQKSLKEGFGLTVAEALWKRKPVIAGAVGGIPLQIAHRYNGILTHSVEGTAFWIKQLLNAPEYARRLGENGREHVRLNFLLPRHLRDYLLLFLFLEHKDERVVHLERMPVEQANQAATR